MTRINVVPVGELSNLHLLAEYRELPRLSKLAHGYVGRREDLPSEYVLGKGHVKFFYMLGGYLRRRFEEEIVPELQRRGYKLNHTTYRPHPEGMNLDYIPTEEALRLNRNRIEERNSNVKSKV